MRGKIALAVVVVTLASASLWHFTRTPTFSLERSSDRNVLLITIDTLRADALGIYGGRATTPNLDRLAVGALIGAAIVALMLALRWIGYRLLA